MINNLTDLEKQLLSEIVKKDGNGEYILESDLKSQYLSILDITIPNKILRGVLSSLVKKGYIKVSEDEGDSLIMLKDLAIEYYKKC
jgi:hypothetical protein